MKSILFALIALSLAACSSAPVRTEWVIDPANKPAMEQFMTVYNECKDFAYKSKVAGSRYAESDIWTSCIQRKGYAFKTVSAE